MRINYQENNNNRKDVSRKTVSQAILEINVFQELTSISSKAGFDSHFYDQQLMADERTLLWIIQIW